MLPDSRSVTAAVSRRQQVTCAQNSSPADCHSLHHACASKRSSEVRLCNRFFEIPKPQCDRLLQNLCPIVTCKRGNIIIPTVGPTLLRDFRPLSEKQYLVASCLQGACAKPMMHCESASRSSASRCEVAKLRCDVTSRYASCYAS